MEHDDDEMMALCRKVLRGHGEMTVDAFIKALSVALGHGRLSAGIRAGLEKQLRTAKRRGVVESGEARGTVCLSTRRITDYNTDYLVESLPKVMRKHASYEREVVMTALAHFVGFRRMTDQVHEVMRSVLNKAIRRGILERDGRDVRRA